MLRIIHEVASASDYIWAIFLMFNSFLIKGVW